ncbi:MAG: hypothetical protein R3D71_01495 [Rickettsiales bacterium]
MRLFPSFIIVFIYFISFSWASEVTIKRVPVQVGTYKYSDCIPSENKVPFGNCLCEAKIYKPVVSGINPVAMKKINGFFDKEVAPRYFEGRSYNSCEGVSVESKDSAKNSRNYDFQVDMNDCSLLAISTSGYYYDYGLPHPNGYSNSHIFNVETGEEYTYQQLFGDNLKKINLFIAKEVEAQKELMYEDLVSRIKEKPDSLWIPAEGIDKGINNLFLTKDGLDMRFDVLPYVMRRTISVSLPLRYIENAHVRECLEKKYAKTKN